MYMKKKDNRYNYPGFKDFCDNPELTSLLKG